MLNETAFGKKSNEKLPPPTNVPTFDDSRRVIYKKGKMYESSHYVIEVSYVDPGNCIQISAFDMESTNHILKKLTSKQTAYVEKSVKKNWEKFTDSLIISRNRIKVPQIASLNSQSRARLSPGSMNAISVNKLPGEKKPLRQKKFLPLFQKPEMPASQKQSARELPQSQSCQRIGSNRAKSMEPRKAKQQKIKPKDAKQYLTNRYLKQVSNRMRSQRRRERAEK